MELYRRTIPLYRSFSGIEFKNLPVSFEIFGPSLDTAPIVVVIHALTGNSDVASEEKGWWREIIGPGKVINTDKFSVVSFNIPGNGYDGFLIDDYNNFIAKDIAKIFRHVLDDLGVKKLHAIMGGSLGGGITWEMACLYPEYADYIIPVAADWKSTDWVIGHNSIQESILLNSNTPLRDARKMAMLFYRTPEALTNKFGRSINESIGIHNVESWLNHHGTKLEERFDRKAYLMMNHLLKNIDVSEQGISIEETLGQIRSTVIQIAIDSDLLFPVTENIRTKSMLDQLGVENKYFEINSLDGHDAFLIEHEQISHFLSNYF